MSTIRRREKKQENNPNKHNSTGSFHPNRDGAGFLSWCMLGGWTGMLRTPEYSEEEEEHRIENSKVLASSFQKHPGVDVFRDGLKTERVRRASPGFSVTF